jgi:hypothetical protein
MGLVEEEGGGDHDLVEEEGEVAEGVGLMMDGRRNPRKEGEEGEEQEGAARGVVVRVRCWVRRGIFAGEGAG